MRQHTIQLLTITVAGDIITVNQGEVHGGEFTLPVTTNACIAENFNQLYHAIISGDAAIIVR
ncbi:hypothetical protein PEC302110_21090 [Pectobacterium araliae]|uniref:Uncharacterized protein n=1 Tax=Pectobacterium araliae TaxID=3073862 RepID=A0AAN0KAM7_9GAMM|nr:hypothetical protein PEC302110_21090 [Pectobacterium sp. MAFF 302110]